MIEKANNTKNLTKGNALKNQPGLWEKNFTVKATPGENKKLLKHLEKIEGKEAMIDKIQIIIDDILAINLLEDIDENRIKSINEKIASLFSTYIWIRSGDLVLGGNFDFDLG